MRNLLDHLTVWPVLAYSIQHVFFVVLRGRWILPRLPFIRLFGVLYVLRLFAAVLGPAKDRLEGAGTLFPWVRYSDLGLVVTAALCSLGLALCLQALVGRLFSRYHREAIAGPDANATASSSESTESRARNNGDVVNEAHPPHLATETHSSGDIGLARLDGNDDDSPSREQLSSVGQGPLSTPPQPSSQSDRPRMRTDDEARQGFLEGCQLLGIGILDTVKKRDDAAGERQVEGSATFLVAPERGQDLSFGGLCFRAVMYPVVVIMRVGLAIMCVYPWVFEWLSVTFGRQDWSTLWLAFGIMNTFTAAVYYLAVFDPMGTSSHKWGELLG